jgi:hypothetical protein
MEAMFIALKNGDGISEGCEDYYSLGCKIETELTAANEKIGRLTVGLANEIKNKGPLVLIHERDSLQSRLTQIKQAGEKLADAANKAAEQWGGPLTQNHDPSFWKSIREATQPLQKGLDEVKMLLAEAQQWIDSEPDWKAKFLANYAKIQDELSQLKQQLAEAVKDTQRLDWLEQYLIAGNDLRIFASDNPTSTIESRGDTGIIIRTALSAAMNNPTKEP